MKPLFAFLAIFFILQNACAQNDKASVDFVRAVFHEKNVSYTDSLPHGAIDEMKSNFDEQFKRKYFKALKITQVEKNYIDRQLVLSKHFTWRPGLFEDERFIAGDTINRVINPPDTSKSTNLFQSYKPFYGFSKPIFLRNHTICFFYQDHSCGSLCGGGNFSVYIKRSHRWVLWSAIYVWVS